jgi:hypothetical protein
MTRIFVAGLLALVVPATLASDKENAAQAFAAGKTALKAADFTKALEQFKTATRGDPDNQQYFNAYTLLRRVIKMREQVTKEMEADAWQQSARQLYAYYHENGISTELVSLASTMHQRAGTVDNAVLLGDAYLDADKPADAVAVFAKVPAEKVTPQINVLHGLALARSGKPDDAKALAAKIELPKDCDAELCYNAARLFALSGLGEKGLTALKCAFEMTPAPDLPVAKTAAKEAKELANLATLPDYAKVMETASKVAAGACGKSCAGCPSAGKDGGCSEEKKDASCEHDKMGKAEKK